MKYKTKKYNLPKINGISEKQLEVHLGLYEGYVKHINTLQKEVEQALSENNTYRANELQRRFGFEFAGMRNHEQYFDAIENGPSGIKDGAFKDKVEEVFGSFEKMIDRLNDFAKTTRGIGWVLLKYDFPAKTFHVIWVSDHELGNVAMATVVAIDMWEHAYMADYTPKEKGEYVKAYLNAIDWNFISERFERMVN